MERYKAYMHLSKLELAVLLGEIERNLSGAIDEARTASREYSDDSRSYLPFEVGHLSGSIKSALYSIERHKKRSSRVEAPAA
jgi:hypothetical protein